MDVWIATHEDRWRSWGGARRSRWPSRSARIAFRDFFLGTALGMAPGTLLLALLADRAHAAWLEPDASHLAVALLLAALLVGSALALRRRFGA